MGSRNLPPNHNLYHFTLTSASIRVRLPLLASISTHVDTIEVNSKRHRAGTLPGVFFLDSGGNQ